MKTNFSGGQSDADKELRVSVFKHRRSRISSKFRIGVFILGALLVGGTATSASFSDSGQASIAGSAGDININLDGNQGNPTPYALPLPSTQFSPGVTTTKTVTLNNTGTLPVVVSMSTSTTGGTTGLASRLTGAISMSGGGSYTGVLRNAAISNKVIAPKSSTIITFTVSAPTSLTDDSQGMSDTVTFTFNAVTQ